MSPHTIDYGWENKKGRQTAISRFRVHWRHHSSPFSRLGSVAMLWHPTRINSSYEWNVNVHQSRCEITSKNNLRDKMHLRQKTFCLPGAFLTGIGSMCPSMFWQLELLVPLNIICSLALDVCHAEDIFILSMQEDIFILSYLLENFKVFT